MTDAATANAPDGQEPSMEDILASIRRILSEDEKGQDAAADPEPQARPAGDENASDEAPQHRGAANGGADADPAALAAALFDTPFPSVPPAAEPERRFRADPFDEPDATAAVVDDEDDDEGDVLLLTPEMRAPASRAAGARLRDQTIVSTGTADSSTDVLSQLARAILDRRDVVVASRDVTLEEMVRGMLRPLLREWLDRNLPYLIERLVKKEIDLMVNRAERLDD